MSQGRLSRPRSNAMLPAHPSSCSSIPCRRHLPPPNPLGRLSNTYKNPVFLGKKISTFSEGSLFRLAAGTALISAQEFQAALGPSGLTQGAGAKRTREAGGTGNKSTQQRGPQLPALGPRAPLSGVAPLFSPQPSASQAPTGDGTCGMLRWANVLLSTWSWGRGGRGEGDARGSAR